MTAKGHSLPFIISSSRLMRFSCSSKIASTVMIPWLTASNALDGANTQTSRNWIDITRMLSETWQLSRVLALLKGFPLAGTCSSRVKNHFKPRLDDAAVAKMKAIKDDLMIIVAAWDEKQKKKITKTKKKLKAEIRVSLLRWFRVVESVDLVGTSRHSRRWWLRFSIPCEANSEKKKSYQFLCVTMSNRLELPWNRLSMLIRVCAVVASERAQFHVETQTNWVNVSGARWGDEQLRSEM